MNQEELMALQEVKDEIRKFRRRYMILWGSIFTVAVVLRYLGLW